IRLEDPDSSSATPTAGLRPPQPSHRLDSPGRQSVQAAVYLTFDPDRLNARLELITLDDAGLQRSWGDEVTRIILETRDDRLSDTIEVRVGY
ncbi:MAG: hypothetical protein ACC655_10735, partial [Rhodothermia bacterium]